MIDLDNLFLLCVLLGSMSGFLLAGCAVVRLWTGEWPR
jgi:hypothetical protein